MGERLPYYVPAYPRSPVTERFKSTMPPVPNAHLDDWTAGHMLTCGKITINFRDWHYHGGLLTVYDTICHPVTPPLSDGEGYPTGKSVMYPIPHVSSLALSQSYSHAFTYGGTVALLCSGIFPFTCYRTHTWMIEVPNTCWHAAK